MGCRFILAFGVLVALLSSECPAQAPVKPDELKVLERFIGKWKFEFISRPAEWTPKEVRMTGTSSNEWLLDGRLQQHKVKFDQGGDGIELWTFDARRRSFRSWSFDDDGRVSEMSGSWDVKTNTLTRKSEIAQGITLVLTTRFVDNQSREIVGVAKDSEGNIYLDFRTKVSRTK